MKYFLAESFKSGHIPFWCPHYFCGSPFMSDIQSGVFYPLSLIMAFLPFPLGFNVYVVVHFFLGFCFFYLFITSLGLSRKSALLTSISYCYGGYTIATLNTLNNLSTAIWLPAILWSFTRATKSGRKSDYFLTILFLAMSILGGEPQLFILSIGILFFYALFSAPDSTEGCRRGLKSASCVIVLLMVAVLVTLVQLGPTYIDYQHSARLGGLSYEEASRFSMGFYILKHLFLPLYFPPGFVTETAALRDFFLRPDEVPWLLTVYPGMIIAPLALVGTLFSFSRKNWVWTAVFFASLVLALGHNTPIHELFYRVFPFFRFPVKFMFAAGFSMLVLAAYGMDRLFSFLGPGTRKATLLSLLLTLTIALDLYSNHKHLNPVTKADFYQYHHPALQPIIDDPDTFRVYMDKMPSPPDIKKSISHHHIKWQMMLLPNLGILHNLDHVGGVPALELRYQHQITEVLSKPWKEKLRFLRLVNVRYIITQEKLHKKPELRGEVTPINDLVYQVQNPLPRVWITGSVRRIKKGTIRDITDDSFDPRFTVLVSENIQTGSEPTFFEPIAHIRYEPGNRIQMHVATRRPGILVLTESSHPGWEVYVDGKLTDLLWLDLMFQGVKLEPGVHDVSFRFRPIHFGIYLLISLTTVIICLFCFIFLRWTGR